MEASSMNNEQNSNWNITSDDAKEKRVKVSPIVAEEILRKHVEKRSIEDGNGVVTDEQWEEGMEAGALQIALEAMEEFAQLKIERHENERIKELEATLEKAYKELKNPNSPSTHVLTILRKGLKITKD